MVKCIQEGRTCYYYVIINKLYRVRYLSGFYILKLPEKRRKKVWRKDKKKKLIHEL